MLRDERNQSVVAVARIVCILMLVCGCGGSGDSENGEATVTPGTVTPPPSTASDEQTTPPEKPTVSSPASTGVGTIAGKIIFDGVPPELAPIVKKGAPIKEPYCAATTIPNESLLVSADGGVANVFVFVTKAPLSANVPPVPSEPVVFDQHHCRFIPRALIMRAGQIVKIKSNDSVAHNTKITPIRNNPFNQIIKINDRVGLDYVYEKSERQPVMVQCDIHNWMTAWHLPLDHPYAAVTDENGAFEIPEMPAGEHVFRIWHESAGYLHRSYRITVEPDKTTEIAVSFKPKDFKVKTSGSG